LARYEALTRNFVTQCQKFALSGVDFHLPKSRVRLWAMSQMMRMLPYLPWRGMVVKGLQSPVKLWPGPSQHSTVESDGNGNRWKLIDVAQHSPQ